MLEKKSEAKVFSKRCEICNKKITSLYKSQLEYNYEQHIKSHERKKKLK